MAPVLRPSQILRKLALFASLLSFSAAGAVLGARHARACTTQYTYGQANCLYIVGSCTCYPDVQGECVEICCYNSGSCGSAPPTAIGCSNGMYCDGTCGACI